MDYYGVLLVRSWVYWIKKCGLHWFVYTFTNRCFW